MGQADTVTLPTALDRSILCSLFAIFTFLMHPTYCSGGVSNRFLTKRDTPPSNSGCLVSIIHVPGVPRPGSTVNALTVSTTMLFTFAAIFIKINKCWINVKQTILPWTWCQFPSQKNDFWGGLNVALTGPLPLSTVNWIAPSFICRTR